MDDVVFGTAAGAFDRYKYEVTAVVVGVQPGVRLM
jgi:hypothetical protein